MRRGIFISYRRSSTSHFAGRLRDRLERIFPGRVFIDVSDIRPGEDFVRSIETTLAKCAVVIAIIGDHWNKPEGGRVFGGADDYVAFELMTALKRGLAVIPALVAGTAMPREEDLPETLKALARMSSFEIRHTHFDDDVADLVGEVYQGLNIKPPNSIESYLGGMSGGVPRVSEVQRAVFAAISFAVGGFSALAAIVPPQELEAVASFALICLVFWPLGKNSAWLGRMANFGAASAALSVLIAIVQTVA